MNSHFWYQNWHSITIRKNLRGTCLYRPSPVQVPTHGVIFIFEDLRNVNSFTDICRYNENQRSQDAINLTFFHWGLHAWVVYVIIGLLLAFLSYRKDLPMTIRTCFYPLLGDAVTGFLGDLIDILSVVATMFGVCTSLGLGVIQLNAGEVCLCLDLFHEFQSRKCFTIRLRPRSHCSVSACLRIWRRKTVSVHAAPF